MLKNKIQGIRVKFECIYDVYYHILKSQKWKIRLSTVKHNDLPAIFNHVEEHPVSKIIWWHLLKFILMSVHEYWFAAFETVFKWYNQTEVSDRNGTMNTEMKMLSLKDIMSRVELTQHSQGVHYYWVTCYDWPQAEVLLNQISSKWGYFLELDIQIKREIGGNKGGYRERR